MAVGCGGCDGHEDVREYNSSDTSFIPAIRWLVRSGELRGTRALTLEYSGAPHLAAKRPNSDLQQHQQHQQWS